MLRFLRFLKFGLVFSIGITASLLTLNYAFVDIIEKTERFTVVNELEAINSYLNQQLAGFEVVASEWAQSPVVTSLFAKNSSKNRKSLLKSGMFKKDAIEFVALININKKIFFSKQFNSKKNVFSTLASKIKYQISTSEFAKQLKADEQSIAYIYSENVYMLAAVPVYLNADAEENIGYLVVGHKVDEKAVEANNFLDISFSTVNLAANSEQARILFDLKDKDISHMRTGSEVISRFLLRDVSNKPIVIVSHTRETTSAGAVLNIAWLSLIVIVIVAIILGYLFWWSKKRKLRIIIDLLEKDIQELRIGAELSSRLTRDGRGLLEGIVTALNQKIGGFEKTVVDNRKHNAEIILNELPLEAYLKDADLKYVAVNERYCESIGLHKENVIGKENNDLEFSNELSLISKNEKTVIDSKEQMIFEETLESKTKGAVTYSVHLIPFLNAKGLVEGVVGVRIDITDQKNAEDEMEMAVKVLENTVEGFMVTNADRHVVHVNSAYTDMTGYEESELLGKVPLLLQAESKSKIYQEIQQKLEQEGMWKGELWSSRKDGSSYPEMIHIKAIRNKQGEVTNYFSMSKDITEEKKWEKRLYEMAHYDSLTELPNRTLFQDRLAQEIVRCERNKKNIGVLFLDIDMFKSINDSLGHAAGDELLKIIATRLQLTLRSADSIARMGGDEFTILVTDLATDYKKNIGYLKSLSEKIIDVVNQPMELEGREISVTCSIGIAVYPVDAHSVDDLLRNADSAMYYAKSQGRRNYQFYSKEFNAAAVDRLEKEIEFRSALKDGGLQLYFQPQIDVITRHVVGAEALLRWVKNGENILGPEKVVILAEEIGLINELGNWILKTACIECKSWLDSGHKNLRVAVNLSTRQFRQKNLVEIVSGILDETGLPGRLLELEVTESALMESVEYSVEMMAELSRKGIRWSLDDFGTGYSSLNYLRNFPVHVLKVDQSFIREITINPEDSAIVETIIDLAHRLHLTVIAEGVESEEQLKVLSRMNCEQVQGYYFSKPITKQEFIKYIDKL